MILAATLWPVAANAEPVAPIDRVGDVHEIRLAYQSTFETNGLSTGSASGREMLIERVIGITETGVELEYDLPDVVPDDERARVWQYPVRVLEPAEGEMRLLNEAELEDRIDAWLDAGGLTREACGSWYFTWNAFKIECDPQSVLVGLERFVLRPGSLDEGVMYRDPHAVRAAPFAETQTESGGASYVAEMTLDPAIMRRAEAEMERVTAQILGHLPVDAAPPALTDTEFSGTITVTYDTDPRGYVWRRIRVWDVEISEPGGETERRRTIETVERRSIPPPSS